MMQVTKVWWDGEKLMAEPIDPAFVYKEPVAQYSDIVSDGGLDPRNKFDVPPAQPAVPDAIIEAGESPDYRDGWNDCRAETLKMRNL
jgi:hypothetical protein